jgi:ribosome-binding ATPase
MWDEAEYVNGNGKLEVIRDIARTEEASVVPICTKLEAEILQVPEEERSAFLRDLGIGEPGLSRVIRESYALLDLITFFTGGDKEVRAWSIRRGSTAYEAAGEIHTDFQRGFIRAEVLSASDLAEFGSESAARERGRIFLQGRDYIVRDGDVIYFRFNV